MYIFRNNFLYIPFNHQEVAGGGKELTAQKAPDIAFYTHLWNKKKNKKQTQQKAGNIDYQTITGLFQSVENTGEGGMKI